MSMMLPNGRKTLNLSGGSGSSSLSVTLASPPHLMLTTLDRYWIVLKDSVSFYRLFTSRLNVSVKTILFLFFFFIIIILGKFIGIIDCIIIDLVILLVVDSLLGRVR